MLIERFKVTENDAFETEPVAAARPSFGRPNAPDARQAASDTLSSLPLREPGSRSPRRAGAGASAG